MNKHYDLAVLYQVTATCLSPLRTGSGDTETVLRNGRHQAICSGTSLAGVLRSGWGYLPQGTPQQEVALFGSQEKGGALIISDGLFQQTSTMELRPRLRMDPATGTGAVGGKFDLAHMATGSILNFSLTWLGQAQQRESLVQLEGLLGLLHQGELTLGAQKSNGFGRVSLEVGKAEFDLKQDADRKAWLAEEWNTTPLSLPRFDLSPRISFTLIGAVEQILVKSSSPMFEEKGSYTQNLKENSGYVLPGSSVKGVLRNQLGKIGKTLGLPRVEEALFGKAQGQDVQAGLVTVSDVQLADRPQKISRIRINRFTAGVIRGGLFSEAPLASPVTLHLSLPKEELVGCGLLLYALRDLALGKCALGSGSSVGRGFLQTEKIIARNWDGREAELVFATQEDGSLSCLSQGDTSLLDGWLHAVEEARG